MTLDKLTLEGRVAIVTGAGRGLGRAMAIAMANAGADIVAASRTASELEQTADEVRARERRCLTIPTDVTRSDQVNAMVVAALKEFGAVDILLNNAGGGTDDYGQPIDRITDEMWRQGIDTNLTSQFYCCRAILPHMISRRRGKIINVASGLGLRGGRQIFTYTCAKGGVIQLTRALAVTYAPDNIQSNCIVPGVFGEAAARFKGGKFIPLGRPGEYQEMGPLAVFLASDASNHLNGALLTLDGGGLAGGLNPTGSYPGT